jgi:hypothetical protein
MESCPASILSDADDKDKERVKLSAVLTLMLGKNNQVYYYEGDDPMKLKASDFNGIRDVILDKKRRSDPKYFDVILKPSQDANFGNTVNILDEMKIDAVSHFALVDISPYEYKIVRATELANRIK